MAPAPLNEKLRVMRSEPKKSYMWWLKAEAISGTSRQVPTLQWCAESAAAVG